MSDAQKLYRVPVVYRIMHTLLVAAHSLEEAEDKALRGEGKPLMQGPNAYKGTVISMDPGLSTEEVTDSVYFNGRPYLLGEGAETFSWVENETLRVAAQVCQKQNDRGALNSLYMAAGREVLLYADTKLKLADGSLLDPEELSPEQAEDYHSVVNTGYMIQGAANGDNFRVVHLALRKFLRYQVYSRRA